MINLRTDRWKLWIASWLWLVAALMASALTATAGETDQRLDVYWVDVEGGAATLLVTPMGESVLIDTGNPGRRDPDRILQVAAKVAGLKQIDHLIITHYHGDHFGGAATLARLMPIRHVYDNGLFEGIRERPDKDYLEFPAEKRHVISPGHVLPLTASTDPSRPSVKLQCLCARQQIIAAAEGLKPNECCPDAQEKPIDNSDNANSVVSLISFGDFRFYDGGDLTWNVEARLVCPVNLIGEVDVYQVTHHGLDSSNNPLVIRSVQPTVAIFNNGVTKGCEPYTFQTLKATSSVQAIYQLHRNERDDQQNNTADDMIANRGKECGANYVKLSVDPQGRTYTVSIPATKHERTFQTKVRPAP